VKIAQIDVNYGFSSTGKIVHDLHVGLKDKGHSVQAFFGRGSDSKLASVYKISNDFEMLLHVVGTRITGFTGGYSPFATMNLLNRLRLFKPDIVHLHDLHGYFLNISPLVYYLKTNNIATVWTFHSDFMFTGKCGSALDCNKWQSHCYACPSLMDYPKTLFFDQSAKMFDTKYKLFEDFVNLKIVTPSDWLADRVRKSVIAGARDVSVISNGLDLDLFYPREVMNTFSGINWKEKFTVISVGSDFWSDLKGGKWILKLAERLPHVFFVMVGVDDRAIDVPANVKLVRPIKDKNLLADFYSAADVTLLTSKQETFSMVTAESLACGTPVIGFDSGAPKEVAPDGYGIFVSHGDIEGLERCIEGHMNNSINIKSPSECSAFVRAMYTKEKMVEKYECTYKNLIEEMEI